MSNGNARNIVSMHVVSVWQARQAFVDIATGYRQALMPRPLATHHSSQHALRLLPGKGEEWIVLLFPYPAALSIHAVWKLPSLFHFSLSVLVC